MKPGVMICAYARPGSGQPKDESDQSRCAVITTIRLSAETSSRAEAASRAAWMTVSGGTSSWASARRGLEISAAAASKASKPRTGHCAISLVRGPPKTIVQALNKFFGSRPLRGVCRTLSRVDDFQFRRLSTRALSQSLMPTAVVVGGGFGGLYAARALARL